MFKSIRFAKNFIMIMKRRENKGKNTPKKKN